MLMEIKFRKFIIHIALIILSIPFFILIYTIAIFEFGWKPSTTPCNTV